VFEQRSCEPEFLDHPDCDPVLAAASYRFMALVNRLFGGVRSVRRFVAAEARALPLGGQPLRILDLGSGSCDIPLAVSRWARRHGFSVHFTCLELSAAAIQSARARLERAGDQTVELVQADAFTYTPAAEFDCAVASMFLHHFTDTQIQGLVQRLPTFVRRSLLINDLRRSRLAHLGAVPLTVYAPQGVRHDAQLSIRRGFTAGDLRRILDRVEGISAKVEPAWLFRVRAVVRFSTAGGGL
jgi:hypothetical protein